MAKNKKATEHEQVALSELDESHTHSVSSLEFLMPAIRILGEIVTENNDSYQSLVSKSQTLHSAKEAGKTLRELSKQYSKVLIAALEYPYDDLDADALDELDFEDEDKSDVDFIED